MPFCVYHIDGIDSMVGFIPVGGQMSIISGDRDWLGTSCWSSVYIPVTSGVGEILLIHLLVHTLIGVPNCLLTLS